MSVKGRLQSLVFTVLTAVAILILAPLVTLIAAIAVYFREPRIAIAGALALLVLTAATLAAGGPEVAEYLAKHAFFFLALGVILLLMQYVRYARAIAAALALLLLTAVAITDGVKEVAQYLASYAYFLLALGVIALLVQHVRGERA